MRQRSKRYRQLIEKRCSEDKWSAELQNCLLASKTLTENKPCEPMFTAAQNAQIARRVQGTVRVPCYLAPSCAPGGRFELDARGLPTRNDLLALRQGRR